MTYRNILVQVDTKPGSKARIEAAVATAKRFEASLTGMFLKAKSLPADVAGDLSAETIKRLEDERATASVKNAKAARTLFDSAAKGVEGGVQWLEFDGDRDDDIIACSRNFDLSIYPALASVEHSRNTITAEQIGMGSGGPVIVTPVGGYKPQLGKSIMVAWKDSRESARALRDAWPFLSSAEEVHFVVVSRTAKKKLNEHLQRHLKAHDVKNVNLVIDRDNDAPTGEIIRRHIDMLGCDMIILGLYGHARVQEYLLGGVSRDFLTALPKPLLISH